MVERVSRTDSTPEERKVDRAFALAGTSFGLATVGTITSSPLIVALGLPVLLYTAAYNVWRIFTVEFKQKRFGVGSIDLISTVGPILTGQIVAASLTLVLYFASRKLLIKTEDNSRKSLLNVFGDQPKTVWVEVDGVQMSQSFEALQEGDVVIVGAGEMIPVDGTVVWGHAAINQCALTGESQLVERGAGETVLASTLLLEGQIGVRVEKAGADTVAAQVGTILNNTADFKSKIAARSERIIEAGAWPTLSLSALTLPLLGVQSAVAMTFASFGYHMRIAGPLSVLSSLRKASEAGVLVKDGRSLELLATVDTFVFDKTGTLTEEMPTVGAIHSTSDLSVEQLLMMAASAERRQTHPIAQALCHTADERNLPTLPIQDVKVEVGYGLQVRMCHPVRHEWVTVRIGSRRYMDMAGISAENRPVPSPGSSLIYLAVDNELAGTIELRPTVRPEAAELVRQLQARGKTIYIISGDHEQPTRQLAQQLGIDHYFAEVLPQDKARHIEQLQADGHEVCFVGDGINDSIALKTANVSVSMSGASTIATDSAAIVLMSASLDLLIPLLDIADGLDKNLTRGTMLTIIPALMCAGGVLFLNFGVAGASILYNAALGVSVANALNSD